jgi:ribosomal protein S18 acetylase RimI-like enzyme
MDPHLKLRKAQHSDIQAVYNLSNDPLVRKNSINQEPIPYPQHEKWFSERLNDPNTLFFIAEDDAGNFAGQARFQKDCDFWIVSISVAPEFRGKHLSSTLLSEALRLSNVSPIRAIIRRHNIPSLMIFERNGFTTEENKTLSQDFISLVFTSPKEAG